MSDKMRFLKKFNPFFLGQQLGKGKGEKMMNSLKFLRGSSRNSLPPSVLLYLLQNGGEALELLDTSTALWVNASLWKKVVSY